MSVHDESWDRPICDIERILQAAHEAGIAHGPTMVGEIVMLLQAFRQ